MQHAARWSALDGGYGLCMQHAAHWSALDGAMGYVCSMLHTGVHLMRGYVCSMLHAGVHLMRLWVMYAACCTLECT